MKKIFISAVLIFLIGVISVSYILFRNNSNESTPTEAFAKCLAEKKAVFYGAFWCSHCQNQKKMFGSAQKYLPYTECSTPDSKDQTQVCKDKKIEGYPTWEFADGSRETGEVSFAKLAEKSGCSAPQ